MTTQTGNDDHSAALAAVAQAITAAAAAQGAKTAALTAAVTAQGQSTRAGLDAIAAQLAGIRACLCDRRGSPETRAMRELALRFGSLPAAQKWGKFEELLGAAIAEDALDA